MKFVSISFVVIITLGVLESAGNRSEWENKEIEQIPQTMNEVRDEMARDSSYDVGSRLFQWNRVIVNNSETIDMNKIIDFYEEIINESTNVDSIKKMILQLETLGKQAQREKKEERHKRILEILNKALAHKYIEVRLWTADRLYNWGYKEDVRHVYSDFIETKNLDKKLEKEFKFQYEGDLRVLDKNKKYYADEAMKIKRKNIEDKISKIDENKNRVIIDVMSKLMEYEDSKSNELVKEAYRESYISSVITDYEKTEYEKKWAKEKQAKFFRKLKMHINKK